jgi:hypothetical protein
MWLIRVGTGLLLAACGLAGTNPAMASVAAGTGATAAADTCPAAIPGCDPTLLARRSVTATPLKGRPPVIDGRLDDAAWAEAAVVTRFMQSRPDPGREAHMRTEARLLYDDRALYVAVRLYDPTPQTILAPFVRRDDETTSDWAFVEIDSRHDRRTGFDFGLNPRGVQVDGLWMDDSNFDSTWDAVWEGAARIDAEGWTAEFRIPFSQLPYTTAAGETASATDAQTNGQTGQQTAGGDTVWGLNIYRNSQHRGEVSNWSPRANGLAGVVSRFNDLHLRVPAHQRRVELTPYVAPRWERAAPGAGGTRESLGGSMKAGADLRVGLGSNFNLTATVLPDFGQVEQDPSQVNLTALELFQTERRPFFIEGVDAFRFDTSLGFVTRGDSFVEESPFYSRRIGHAPSGAPPPGADALGFSMPATSRLLGAAKLSGHTSSGWTAGIFSAITAREEGTVQRRLNGGAGAEGAAAAGELAGSAGGSSGGTTGAASGSVGNAGSSGGAGRGTDDIGPALGPWPVEPLTATTVARVARDFGAGESTVGAFVSDTHRTGLDGVLRGEFVRDALTVGVEGRHRFADQTYELRGWWLGTRLSGDAAAIALVATEPQHYFQRPDAGSLRLTPDATSLSGFSSEARLARVSGRLTWSLATRAISPGFDVNAAGFQRNANWILTSGAWQYQRYVSAHGLRAWAVGSDNAGIGWSWRGEPRARALNAFTRLDFRNYWDVKVSLNHDLSALSFDWMRGGPAVRLPGRTTLAISTHTDQRRPTNLGLDATVIREPDSASWGYMLSPLLTVRSTDHVAWSIGPTLQQDVVGWQYAGRTRQADAGQHDAAQHDADTYFVARVRQRTAAITTRTDIAFTSRLVLQLYAQPFATIGRYDHYQQLIAPRAADAAAQFTAVASPFTSPPDATQRTLNGNLVLRWEYHPGSFFTVVWNHQRDTTILDAARGLNGTLGSLFRDPSTNVFLVKTSIRLGT